MPPVPPSIAALVERVDAALPAAVAPALGRVAALDPALAPWADELSGMLAAGGKRLRPALLLLGHRTAGGADPDPVVPAGLALELLHTSALLHDDLIDGAATRRGRTTAHVAFAATHAARGYAGDAERYGAAAAVLVGDLAFVVADELFLRADVPPAQLLAGFRAFTRLREEVMAGQALDVQAAATRSTSRALALTVAAAKSGRYSVARPLEVGALLAGADEHAAARLAAAAEPLGQAFQVRDDLLGVFGEQGTTGKSAADDLREGKRTLLVVEALDRLDPAGHAELQSLLGDPTLDDERVERARALIRASGAVEATKRWIEGALDRGVTALAELPMDADVRATFDELAAWLAGRTA